MKKAVVIIPTYNEKENITRVVPILMDVFNEIEDWDMQILVVDDTSPDKTYEVVQEMQRRNKRLHLVINKQKSGLGGAYLKGMAHAFGEMDADVVFEFDADLSHDATKIPLFLKKIEEGYDMVLGSRYIPGGGIPADWGIERKFLSIVGNLVIATVFTNFSIRDWTSGYRAITKPVYEAVKDEMNLERFAGYSFQIGFLHKAIRKGFKVTDKVPYKFVDRTEGQSKLGPEYIKNNLLFIFKVRMLEILNHRIFKFLMVGGTGTLIQLITLQLFRALLPQFSYLFLTNFVLSTFLSVEVAIASNFTLNNLWTFADRKIKLKEIPAKFIHFNVASAGSILIQLLVATIGERAFGIFPVITLPVVNMTVDSGTIYVMIGIVIGLFWNFFAYNTFIWKKKK